ncbi:hypothetical protein BDV11DRAFT_209386 [Aspergillus similis]
MGQTASVPKPGTQIQVIGAGLPRTGTSSFSTALAILLDGPVYHINTQITAGPPAEIKAWIRILRAWVDGDRRTVLSLLRSRLTGYAAVTDTPGCQLIPELLELYPHAKVRSMTQAHGMTVLWFLRILLLPHPGMRHFVDFTWLVRRLWSGRYANGRRLTSVKKVRETLPTRETYARHLAWLKEVVPPDQLLMFDVREGWGPLCEALGKELPPEHVPFPHENDSAGIERTARYIQRALLCWAGIFAVAGFAIVVGFTRR